MMKLCSTSSSCSCSSSSIILIFLVLLLVSLNGDITVEGDCVPAPEDASALLEFKLGLWSHDASLSTWDSYNSSLCNNLSLITTSTSRCLWRGVECQSITHGRVVGLDLSSLDIYGPISPSLGRLCSLSYLNLSSNSFSGTIPPQLANCTALQKLELYDNQLTGQIPPELGNLDRLQWLVLEVNRFTGPLPVALANCTPLELIFLDNNALKGSVPPEFGTLSRLQKLVLGWGQLWGEIPTTLANCSALDTLELSHNQLTGSIPPELGRLQRLQLLYLQQNRLTGGIPASLGNCTALRRIDFANNTQLGGSFRPELGRLHNLQSVLLWRAGLTGAVPHIMIALTNLTSLQRLDLSRNQLSGFVPPEFGLLKRLVLLGLNSQSAELTGDLPAALTNCTELQILDLSENQLIGDLPVEMGKMRNLQGLYLGLNGFTGSLPMSLSNCSALQILSLSNNQLSAGNPANFLSQLLNNLTQLQLLQLAANRFVGSIPPDAFNGSPNLLSLDLSFNNFGGRLPRSLGELSALITLTLSNNLFEGSISTNLLNSLSLQQLDLSSNNLSGTIPASVGRLTALLQLDLSHNSLMGSLPAGLGMLQQLQSLNVSHNNLSGDIPTALQGCVALQILNLSKNKLGGNLTESLAGLHSITLLDLSYNQLEGPVPNMAPFDNASITNLTGNPGLCGQIVDRACANVSVNRSSKLIIWVAPPVSVVAVACMLFLGMVCYCRKFSKSKLRLLDPILTKQHLNVTGEELQRATNGFHEENIIGRGGVSTVYRAVFSGGKAGAVKFFDREVPLKVEEDFRREVRMLARVRHRNVVRVYGCCFNLDIKALILELMPNGSLADYLHGASQKRQCYNTKEILQILRGVAEGLSYLHHDHPDGAIVHCDIKPANILLDANLEPRISDFGIAKLVDGSTYEDSASILLRGSVGYIPPEYGSNTYVSTKGDVYSFGVVFIEVLTGKRPTDQLEEHQTLVSLLRSCFPDKLFSILKPHSTTDQDILLKLARLALLSTQDLPSERPSMHEILNNLKSLGEGEDPSIEVASLSRLTHIASSLTYESDEC